MVREELRQFVRDRASGCCEYCHFPEPHSFWLFQVDHIIAEKHFGLTTESNLAWSCYYCNSFKGPNLSGWDSQADEVVRLCHSRRDRWPDHFAWLGPLLIGLTSIGKVTIIVLNINHPDAVAVRAQFLALGEQLRT
jgi:hypothetical protein